jgi:hypothetical protein
LKKNYKKDDILSHIYNIQKAIEESGRQKSITLFRGITAIDFDIHHTFNEKGFSSCTTDIDIATKNYSNDGCCTLSFILPTNIDAYIYKYKGKYTEDEYILRRNIEYFNIEYIKTYNGVKIYSCNIRPYKLPSEIQEINYEKTRTELIKKLLEEDDSDFEY